MKINYTDEQTEAMKRLYGQFVRPGDLVFNVGANIGTRTQIFVDLGAEVVALEPQPNVAYVLRKRYMDEDEQRVYVIEAAAGPEAGTVKLMLCTDNQLATCAPGWAESLADRWPMEKWQEAIDVQQVTLDSLIPIYGIPDFIKIDVEGYEREVIKGLSQRVDWLCFEATIPYVDPAIECVTDLNERLHFTWFNYLIQERMELVLDNWVTAKKMQEILRSLPASTFYVDVFAR